MGIMEVLEGRLPDFVKKAKGAKYYRDYQKRMLQENPWIAEKYRYARRLRYREDAEFRERRLAEEKARREARTPEQRKQDYARRKAKTLSLSDEEFERRRYMSQEACRRYRERKKIAQGEFWKKPRHIDYALVLLSSGAKWRSEIGEFCGSGDGGYTTRMLNKMENAGLVVGRRVSNGHGISKHYTITDAGVEEAVFSALRIALTERGYGRVCLDSQI